MRDAEGGTRRRRMIEDQPGDGPLEGAIRDGLFGTTGDLRTLADEIGVSYHTVWCWRTGRRIPPVDQLRRLAGVLERRGGEVLGSARKLRELVEASADSAATG